VVDRAAMGQVFAWYFAFATNYSTECSTFISIHPPRAGTIGQIVGEVLNGLSLTLTQESKKKKERKKERKEKEKRKKTILPSPFYPEELPVCLSNGEVASSPLPVFNPNQSTWSFTFISHIHLHGL
jgi:hypothetical protein